MSKNTVTIYTRGDSASTAESYSIKELLLKKGLKKDTLSKKEIKYFVKCVTEVTKQEEQLANLQIQKEQIGAMCMAMLLNGLTDDETAYLLEAMIHFSDKPTWPAEWIVVDKHSTGGVGDKISLILAPALAACGLKVPMISGKGLGHTGGTLDKLESIDGFNISLGFDRMEKVLTDVGCCIVGQTSSIVPADKILYEVRDATSTVMENGLITASILSKKIVVSPKALILDVKLGKGAFCDSEEKAEKLALKMVRAGNILGVNTKALLTDMNSPLGHTIGNSLEVAESIQCLQGKGPDDLTELVKELGGHLLSSVNKAPTLEEAKDMIKTCLQDGSALEKFADMIEAQGVNSDVANKLRGQRENIFNQLKRSRQISTLKAKASGYVHEIDALKCGRVSVKLGAGRTKAGEKINHAVGLKLLTHIGKEIVKGDDWVEIHHDDDLTEEILHHLQDAIVIKPEKITASLRKIKVVELLRTECT